MRGSMFTFFSNYLKATFDYSRALWQQKKQEEQDLLFRDVEEIKELSRAKMFGK